MSVATTIAKNKEKASAKNEIVDSIRNLLSLKITLPLGNPNLKLVHTNQFLFTELPTDVFSLANFKVISEALNSGYSRFSGYEINRWYVEGVTINNNGNSATMELEVNPFASDLNKFADDKKSLEKAFVDAFTQKTTSTSSAKTVKSVPNKNTTLKGGYGKWVDNKVKKIVGKTTDALAKAKLIDKAFKSHIHYSKYDDLKYGKSESNEHRWKRKYLNCADGAQLLSAMLNSAGVNATICHITTSICGHYIVMIKYKGKKYFTDCSGSNGGLCNKKFNVVWGHKNYDRICGKQLNG